MADDTAGDRPTGLGHVHLKVRDVDRAVAFYCEVYLDTRAERDQHEWEGVNEPFDPLALE